MLQHWGENDRSRPSAKDTITEWALVGLAVPAVIAQVLVFGLAVLHTFR